MMEANVRKQDKGIYRSLLEMGSIARHRDRHEVFSDFVELAALFIDIEVNTPEYRERHYKRMEVILNQYSLDQVTQLVNLINEFFLLCQGYSKMGEFVDVLGYLYERCSAPDKSRAQDFSPTGLGTLVAKVATADDVEKLIKESIARKGYYLLVDPTCGAGALFLAFAQRINELGYDHREHMLVCGQDISRICTLMSFVQSALYGITGVVIQQNILTLEETCRWYTPNYILNDWIWREPFQITDRAVTEIEMLKLQSPDWYNVSRMNWALLSKEDQKKYSEESKEFLGF